MDGHLHSTELVIRGVALFLQVHCEEGKSLLAVLWKLDYSMGRVKVSYTISRLLAVFQPNSNLYHLDIHLIPYL